jgi:hypothetical protein
MKRTTEPALTALCFVLLSAACADKNEPSGESQPLANASASGTSTLPPVGATASTEIPTGPTNASPSMTGTVAGPVSPLPSGTETGPTEAVPSDTVAGPVSPVPSVTASADSGSGGAGSPPAGSGPDLGGSGGMDTGVDPETDSMGGSGSTDETAPDGSSDATTDNGTGELPTDGYPEFPGAACDAPAGEYGAVEEPNLPNPFQMHNGDIISTKAQWECRRAQIIHDLEEFEVGPKPPPPQVEAHLEGSTLNVVVTTDAGSITLTSNTSGSGPCVAIGVDGPSSMISGCLNVPFSANQVAREGTTGDAFDTDGYYQVYPDLWTAQGDGNSEIGNYSAWPWGVSRLIDGLDQVKDELGIDMTKIGIHGCSWAGKLALWAGALDARIALTVAQECGGGGVASWRISDDYETATGSGVEDLDNTGWAWFKDWLVEPYIEAGGGGKNPHLLPHDHHELLALIAPRAVIVLPGDPGNTHLAPHSAYASFQAAKQVWIALGVEDHAGIVGHSQGGAHCQASQSQSQAVNAFVDRFLKGGSGATQFNSGVDYNWESYVNWETPTLQ